MRKPKAMAKSTDPSQNSKSLLLAAAKAVMEDAGYAAVTSRRVAAKAGLKPQLVHYYFESMDDLLVELFRGLAKEILDLQAAALKTEQPLHELWKFLADGNRRILLEQFLLMSRYHDGLQEEMKRFGSIYRQEQIALMTKLARENSVERFPWSPEFLAILFNALSRALSIEPSYGLDLGNKESMESLNYFLDKFDRKVPDPEATIKRLEEENAVLKATIAQLTRKET